MGRLTLDAVLAGEREVLREVSDALFDAAAILHPDCSEKSQRAAGRLLAMAEFADLAVSRAAPAMAAAELGPNTWAARMLAFVAENPDCTNSDFTSELKVDKTEVSRSGRRLILLGVAACRRVGRENRWSITPRGRSSLARLQSLSAASLPGATPDQGIVTPAQAVPAEVQVMRRLLESDDQQSVAAVAEVTGLSPHAAAGAVARLARKSYVVPHAPTEDLGDETRIGWGVGDSPLRAIGVTIQPDHLRGVLTTMDAQWVPPGICREINTSDPVTVAAAVADLAEELAEAGGVSRQSIVGIGVNLSGHIDGDSGTVVSSHALGRERWKAVQFAQQVRESSGFEVVIENDCNALALHAHTFGAARGYDDVVVVFIAPNGGVGAGIIVEGRLMPGHAWAAGEMGHLPIAGSTWQCRCGHIGCLETSMYVSTLSDRIVAGGGPPVATLAEAAHTAHVEDTQGVDGPALQSFRASGRDFGVGLAAVANLIDPQKVMLTGPVEFLNPDTHRSAREFDRGLRETFAAHGFNRSGDGRTIARAYQSPYDAAIGAAGVLLRRTVYAAPSETPETAANAVPWAKQSAIDVPQPTRQEPSLAQVVRS
jgi:predicted NBD/HSP70 family sugar kinase/DNA-binding MarR family transcriptional regulator